MPVRATWRPQKPGADRRLDSLLRAPTPHRQLLHIAIGIGSRRRRRRGVADRSHCSRRPWRFRSQPKPGRVGRPENARTRPNHAMLRRMWQAETAEWIAFVLACLLALHLGHTVVVRLHRRACIKRRQRRALHGEREAHGLLSRLGYRIDGAQVEHSYDVDCDGEPATVRLRADYLVTRHGQRYLAEVKTGSAAPKLSHTATRRQLLEYSLAYDVDGVLLVDMAAGEVHQVEFPTLSRPAHRGNRFVLGVAVGIAGAFLVQQLLHVL